MFSSFDQNTGKKASPFLLRSLSLGLWRCFSFSNRSDGVDLLKAAHLWWTYCQSDCRTLQIPQLHSLALMIHIQSWPSPVPTPRPLLGSKTKHTGYWAGTGKQKADKESQRNEEETGQGTIHEHRLQLPLLCPIRLNLQNRTSDRNLLRASRWQ